MDSLCVDLHDVRRPEPGHRLRLALEARQSLRVFGKNIGQDLKGDIPPKALISRTVDYSHTPTAEQRKKPVWPNLADNWRYSWKRGCNLRTIGQRSSRNLKGRRFDEAGRFAVAGN
jgi:hypothetical protein